MRRDWLRCFLTRKTAPKSAAGFVAAALAIDPTTITDAKGHALAAELLGLAPHQGYGRHPGLAELIDKASEARDRSSPSPRPSPDTKRPLAPTRGDR